MNLFVVDSAQLTALLIKRQLNPVDLARKMHVTPATITRLMQRDSPCRLKTLGQLATALDTDYRQLLKEDSDL